MFGIRNRRWLQALERMLKASARLNWGTSRIPSVWAGFVKWRTALRRIKKFTAAAIAAKRGKMIIAALKPSATQESRPGEGLSRSEVGNVSRTGSLRVSASAPKIL